MNTPAQRQVTRAALIEQNTQRAIEQRDEWVAIIQSRVSALIERNQHVAVEWVDGRKGGIVGTMKENSFVVALALVIDSIDFEFFTDILGNDDADKVPAQVYIQAKTVVKIVNLIFALAGGQMNKLSAYTLQVVYNALHNGGSLSKQGGHAALTKRVSAVDLPNQEQIVSRANFTTGTANAQLPQVRELLRVLQLADINKNKKDDPIVMRAQCITMLQELFNNAGITEAQVNKVLETEPV